VKLQKKYLFLIWVAIFITSFIGCAKKGQIAVDDTNVTSLVKNSVTEQSTSIPLDSETIASIRKNIDARVSEINKNLSRELYSDHYEGDILVYRNFTHYSDEELSAQYYLYFDDKGKLIFTDIIHYRAAMYSIYFHNDELLYTEVGPFAYNDPIFIKGGMEEVEAVVEKSDKYDFVLEDIEICLESAYKK